MAALWFETALLPGGWSGRVRLRHHAGLITNIETEATPAPGDERGSIALPGLPNLHSHAFQRAMAGLAESRGVPGEDFWSWREVMYRFAHRLTPDDVEAIAAQAFAEMLETGFTRVGEFHYLHHQPDGRPYDDPAEMAARVAAAAEATGIGLTLLPVFYAHGGFGGVAAGVDQRRFINDIDSFGRLLAASRTALAPLADPVVGLAPHSLRAVTQAELAAILPLAGAGPIHIHVAEQTAEIDASLVWSGARPVEWLLANAPVDRRWCLVHATHMSDAETDAAAATGAVVGLCPITEANLGDGVFPAARFFGAGGAFGVGSDSNVLIDAAAELRTLEYVQRLVLRARGVLASDARPSVGASLFAAAANGGARALGVEAAGLAPGASLDLIELDGSHPSLAGRSGDALLDGWIFAARRGAVDGVWRRGRKVVAQGRHVHAEAIAQRYRAAVARGS